MRLFLILSVLLALFLFSASCKKSIGGGSSPQTGNPGRPIRSMTVIYDSGTRIVSYHFDNDTTKNTLTIQFTDSITYNYLIQVYHSSKSYTLGGPDRSRIDEESFVSETGFNYDIKYSYQGDSSVPSSISITNTGALNNQYQDIIYDDQGISYTGYYDVPSLLFVNTITTYPNDYLVYQHSGDPNDPTNYATFENRPLDATTLQMQETISSGSWYAFFEEFFPYQYQLADYFYYQYKYDASGNCRNFTINCVVPGDSSTPSGSVGLVVPTAQRKLDFSYDGNSSALKALFQGKYFANQQALYWEKVALEATAFNARLIYFSDKDTYQPDLYSYYQDICSSYTDSVFSASPDYSRQLVSADKFTNVITKDAMGEITKITKYDVADTVFRVINIGY